MTDRHTKKAVFTWDHALKETCKSFGHVCFSSVSASRCTAVGDGVRRATVDEAAVVSVRLFNKDGICCVDEVPVSLWLLDSHGEYGVRGEEQRREDNVVTFKYVQKEPGVWQLHVDVLNGIILLYIYNNIMYYQCISAMVLYCCSLLLQHHL